MHDINIENKLRCEIILAQSYSLTFENIKHLESFTKGSDG